MKFKRFDSRHVQLGELQGRRLHSPPKSQNYWLLLPFLLLFIGDAQVPVSGSSITVPLGMILLLPAFLLMIACARVAPCTPAALLIAVLAFGAVGSAMTPLSLATRTAAGALPLVFAAATLFVYEHYRIRYDSAITCMLAGGVLLSIAVLVLAVVSLRAGGDYYEQKLLIETPLGRSNYLSAFLIFLVALSIPRSGWLTALFMAAVVGTMSRGGGLMLLLLVISVPLARRKKLWWVGAAALLTFISIAYVAADGMVDVIEWFIDPTDGRLDSTINRMLVWSFGLDVWWSNPVFGIGPNTFRTFVESADGVEDVWGVHNSILLTMLNYGIAGLVLYGCYLRLVYRSILGAEQVDGRFIYVRTAFVVLLIFGLFEPLVGSAAFELLIALTYALSQGALRNSNRIQSLPRSLNFISASRQ